jgi:hypothetical protein
MRVDGRPLSDTPKTAGRELTVIELLWLARPLSGFDRDSPGISELKNRCRIQIARAAAYETNVSSVAIANADSCLISPDDLTLARRTGRGFEHKLIRALHHVRSLQQSASFRDVKDVTLNIAILEHD